MGKEFKLLTAVKSNEVSLCSKYNSGANKQTEFEIVKNEDGTIDKDVKPVIEQLIKFADFYADEVKAEEENCPVKGFVDFLNYWAEYDVNNTYYNLLSEALQNALYDIKYAELTKDEKVAKYRELFDTFIAEYQTLPITKTKEGKYEVSLASDSHIKDVDATPQNETNNITKEKTSKMENEELNVIQKALDLIQNALGLKKTEAPVEEQSEEQTEEVAKSEEKPEEDVTEEVEATAEAEEPKAEEIEAEKAEEEPAKEEANEEAEVEAPIVEKAEEEVEEAEKTEEGEEVAKTSETEIEELRKAKLEVEKELADLKKSQAEKEVEIEKMSFIQKAKDEYSMLVGTPEEIGEKLYSISKSNLGDEVKSFVMEQLKKVASENEEATQEVGSITKNAGDMSDEDVIFAKAEEVAKTKGISINKALREVSK